MISNFGYQRYVLKQAEYSKGVLQFLVTPIRPGFSVTKFLAPAAHWHETKWDYLAPRFWRRILGLELDFGLRLGIGLGPGLWLGLGSGSGSGSGSGLEFNINDSLRTANIWRQNGGATKYHTRHEKGFHSTQFLTSDVGYNLQNIHQYQFYYFHQKAIILARTRSHGNFSQLAF